MLVGVVAVTRTLIDRPPALESSVCRSGRGDRRDVPQARSPDRDLVIGAVRSSLQEAEGATGRGTGGERPDVVGGIAPDVAAEPRCTSPRRAYERHPVATKVALGAFVAGVAWDREPIAPTETVGPRARRGRRSPLRPCGRLDRSCRCRPSDLRTFSAGAQPRHRRPDLQTLRALRAGQHRSLVLRAGRAGVALRALRASAASAVGRRGAVRPVGPCAPAAPAGRQRRWPVGPSAPCALWPRDRRRTVPFLIWLESVMR